jgi:tetratricopeptide (TPR) repeat protein
MTRSSAAPRFLSNLWWLAIVCLPTACFHPSTTTRVVDGKPRQGRYISPAAYDSVMQAALLEAQGKLRAAREAYSAATSYDGDSAEIWTRIGALDCRLDRNANDDAFERAESIDARYEPLWRERARCFLTRGDARSALEAARHAVALDPTQAEATELVAQSFERLGEPESAERWRRGLSFAASHAVIHSAGPAQTKSITPADLDALNAALAEPDLTHARALANQHGIDAADLALRAVEIGQLKAALLQAELVLGANPSSADARVAALVAADLSGNEARFNAFLVTPAGALQPLGDKARVFLRRLLMRRALPDAAETMTLR